MLCKDRGKSVRPPIVNTYSRRDRKGNRIVESEEP